MLPKYLCRIASLRVKVQYIQKVLEILVIKESGVGKHQTVQLDLEVVLS